MGHISTTLLGVRTHAFGFLAAVFTLLVFVVASLSSISDGYAQTQTTAPFKWSNVNIQGMGYVTGIVINEKAPYARYLRTDVGGVYYLDIVSSKWVNRCDRFSRLQKEVCDVESIAVDTVNADRVWKAAPLGRELLPDGTTIAYKGDVLVSDDRGANWRSTGLAAKNIYMGGNDDFRGMAGERLLVDPFDVEHVFFGSRKQGLWVRSGRQWSQVANGFPAAVENPGVTFVVADRSAGALNGRAKTLYAGVYGSGVWASNDAGVTWALAAGSPNAYPLRAAVSSNGALFVTFGGDEGNAFKGVKIDGGAWRLKAGAWARMANGIGGTFAGVSVDPNNANNVIVAKGSGRAIYRSENGGDSWIAVPKTVIQAEPAYYPDPKPSNYNANVGEWGNAGLAFDPIAKDTVWQTNGFGVIYTPKINTPSPTWFWSMNGIEELVVRQIKAPPLVTLPGTSEPGAELVSAVADMIGFRHAKVDQVPSATLAPIDYVSGGTGIDYSGQKPEHMAFVGWDQDKGNGSWWAVRTGNSSDNGKTFTPFASTSPGSGGVIAMSATNPDNMVWAPTRWAKPQVTFDKGKTWQKTTMTDGKDLPASWKLSNEWWTGQLMVADRLDGKRFYYFEGYRFYTSADGGLTWQASALNGDQQGLAPWWTIDTNVVVNPERTGQVFLTFAPNTNQTAAFKMFRSDDFGMTFKPVTTADSVNHLAFGRGDAAGAPYMFIHGRVGGATKDGVYRSRDSGATWELVSNPDENQFGAIKNMTASMLKKNAVYIGTGGRGIFAGNGETVPQGNGRGVNAGGTAQGTYQNDSGFDGGFTFTTDKPVDSYSVERPAPQAVYQSERAGDSFTYKSPVLAEGRRYLVRLHFAEIWWGVEGNGGVSNGVGMRKIDVTINGTKVLADFDVFKEAGGANKAVVAAFPASSNSFGDILIRFDASSSSPDRNAKISGIEFIEIGF
jgi:xyloglucan-specific exo-beta-1,4-glucanase